MQLWLIHIFFFCFFSPLWNVDWAWDCKCGWETSYQKMVDWALYGMTDCSSIFYYNGLLDYSFLCFIVRNLRACLILISKIICFLNCFDTIYVKLMQLHLTLKGPLANLIKIILVRFNWYIYPYCLYHSLVKFLSFSFYILIRTNLILVL